MGLAAGIVRDKERTCRDRNGRCSGIDASPSSKSHLPLFLRPAGALLTLTLTTLTSFDLLNASTTKTNNGFFFTPQQSHAITRCEHAMSVCEIPYRMSTD